MKIINSRFFSAYYRNQFCWFRIFGYGLVIKNIKKHPPRFSERAGYVKTLKIGSILITTLK